MSQSFNILIAGVGGQGNLRAGNAIAWAAMSSGLRVMIGQIFGASRRGGTVFTHVRIGKRDLGPLIPRGLVDVIVGMEPLETLRAFYELGSKRTHVLMNKHPIPTLDTLSGSRRYPPVDAIIKAIAAAGKEMIVVDCTKALKELNAVQSTNIYMLGVMVATQETPFSREMLRAGILAIFRQPGTNANVFDRAVMDFDHL